MTYEGDKNFIFISYAHKDAPQVLPIIDVLNERGFRVWYDAGIEAGTEWPEYIEEHIKKASVMLAFMTPNAVASKNCRNEINFALELDKDILVVYLEDTPLQKGMRLQLNSTQSLFRKNHSSGETFIRELLNARILRNCREIPGEAEETPRESTVADRPASAISNISSIGTNDANDTWPKGRYSQTFNPEEYSVVFFHVRLLKPFGFAGTVSVNYQVFNGENNLIFDEEAELCVEPDYDRIYKGWILKGSDGSVVPDGDYRFVCSVNHSPKFTYFFTVCSGREKPTEVPAGKSFFARMKKFFLG